jgi:hypothetical protein
MFDRGPKGSASSYEEYSANSILMQVGTFLAHTYLEVTNGNCNGYA